MTLDSAREQIERLLAGDLSREECQELESLLAETPDLQREYEALEELLATYALAMSPPEDPPETLRGAILQSIAADESDPEPRLSKQKSSWWTWLKITVLSAFTAGLLVNLLKRNRRK